MRDLSANQLADDPRVIEAKRLVLEALADHQERVVGIRPSNPDLRTAYAELIAHFSELRGSPLFFPYLGSGFGNHSLVELADGSVKYDFITGIGVHSFGHCNPAIVRTLLDAALTGVVMQGNLQQDALVVPLVQTLLDGSNRKGATLKHCFLSTSGAMANENALKLIFQRNHPASRLLAFESCFMGRTLALARVTDNPAYRQGLPATLDVDYVPFYDSSRPAESTAKSVATLKRHLARHPGDYAGMVFELVQGGGGFYPGEREFFIALMRIVKEAGAAVLIDEVQTFGRMTDLFAFQHFGLDAYVDVVTIGKLSQVCATLIREEYRPGPGLISQTFTGSTSSIYASKVIVDTLLSGGYFGPAGKIFQLHAHFKKCLKAIEKRHPAWVSGPFGIGAMIALTVFDGNLETTKKFLHSLFEAGVMGFYAGMDPARVRFLIPVGVVSIEDIDNVSAIVEKTLAEVAATIEWAAAMIIIRPIEPSDLDSLSALADLTLFGLTTLPRDRELLRERIHESRRSFESKTKKPRGETYLFVMEDRQTGRVVGTCGIDAKVGGFEPFYAYLIETTLHESKVLNIRKEIRMLHLLQEHSGPSEIGSLFLSPEYRKSGNGRLLSLCRFMFMAEFRERFESQVIAEMRGVIDENGGSAFWEALGRHFFDVDFPRADYLSMKDKRFIAELMPTHPIYIDLLPQDARAVIGEVHPKTRPALRMLQKEGFQFSGMVDIFDGGPVMTSPLENIRTVRERAKTTVSEITNEGVPSEGLLLTNTDPDFRACVAPIAFVPDGGARINKTTAEALLLKAGGEMCFSPLRAR